MDKERKRMCLNCKHREIRGASDFCTYIQPPQYMHYADVFERWCPHWSASERIKQYGQENPAK